MVELKYGRKKRFFTVFYRSSSFNYASTEFEAFLVHFKNLYSKINAENRFAMFFAGDSNGKSQLWSPDGEETPKGRDNEDILTSLCLPTNFEPGKKTSCIAIIVTDQPNIALDSGTRTSLDPFCLHQIIYCKANIRIPPPLPFKRKLLHFNGVNTAAIKRSMTKFPWQVKTFTDILLNIMSNFVPNETKKICSS